MGTARRRTHDPLELRCWVVKKEPEEIACALKERIDAVDEAMAGYQKNIAAGLAAWIEPEVNHLGGKLLPLTPEGLKWASRRFGLILAARYWSGRLLNGKQLPRIAVFGAPWEVFLDEIHVLDLPPKEIRGTLSEWVKCLAAGIAGTLQDPESGKPLPLPNELFEGAIWEIRCHPLQAVNNPIIHAIKYELIKTAHYSPNLAERRTATKRLTKVLKAFRPNLSRHVSRRDEQLLSCLEAYKDVYEKVEPLHRDLTDKGVTPALLRRFRERIEGRITFSDLKKWQRMPASDVALDITRRPFNLAPRSLQDLLTRARDVRDIRAAWDKFRAAMPQEELARLLPTASRPPAIPSGS